MKQLLISAVLAIPVDSDEFLLETDPSGHAVAGVLSVNKLKD